MQSPNGHQDTFMVVFLVLILFNVNANPNNDPADSSQEGSSPWPMFRREQNLSGASNSSVSTSLKLIWKFKAGGPVTSSPAVVDGQVIFGSNDGKVYAISAGNGKLNWIFATGGAMEASPLILEGIVYIGSSDTFLYALKTENGELIWKYKTGDRVLGAPNWFVAPDDKSKKIVFGSYDASLYCLDSASGELVWNYETGSYINGTPTVSDGNIIFGGCDGNIYVLSSKDGSVRRTIRLNAYIAGSAAVINGNVYLGHYGNKCVSLNIETSKINWSYFYKNFPYFSSPAIWGNYMVIGGRDKYLHCIGKDDGKGIWRFRTGGRIDSSPAICDDKVMVGADDGFGTQSSFLLGTQNRTPVTTGIVKRLQFTVLIANNQDIL